MTEIEHKDLEIIEALKRDARKSFSNLSAEIGIPRTTLQERVRRLIERGVIKSFTVIPDYAKLGKPATAFILVSFMPGTDYSQREVANNIAQLDNVYEVHLISGDWDILIKVRGRSMEEIGNLVIDRIRAMRGVARTITCAAFTTVKEEP